MQQRWFPNKQIVVNKDFLHFTRTDDFTKLASEQGFFTPLQVGAGAFDGKLMKATIGHATVFMDYSNLPLEKQIKNSSTEFIFIVTLDQAPTELIYGGVKEPNDLVCVIPPGGEVVRITQPELTGLVLKVEQKHLFESLENFPWLNEWLRNLESCTRLNSAWLADRLRSDIFLALEGAIASRSKKQLQAIDRVVILSVLHAFALEQAAKNTLKTLKETAASERFLNARARLLDQLAESQGEAAPKSLNLPGSKRAVEKAFAECVKMGPLAYARVVRLHNTRSKLLDEQRLQESIGDIAAEDGFWEWGRFSKYYREQFGELPSDTRQRLTG